MDKNYDFSGWATRVNLKCSDGLTIIKDAFKDCDGKKVPLVWNHCHNDPEQVLGHAILENREEGVYTYCSFNDTPNAATAKELVMHGDVNSLSIWANELKKNLSNVMHGNIREVSLVLAGANPGAFIDSVISHGEASEDEAIIYTGEDISLSHSDGAKIEVEGSSKIDDSKDDKVSAIEHSDTKKENEEENKTMAEEATSKNTENTEETVKDVFDTLTEKQKTVVYAMIGKALEENDDEEDEGGNENMKHNVFDQEGQQTDILSHSDMEAIISDAKRSGSLRDAVISHGIEDDSLMHTVNDANGNAVSYGIANIDYLFPDARTVSNTPDFIARDMDWVAKVMNGAKHLPFSRVKSVHANITMDEARAKGYTKGAQKAEEVFALLKRVTTPGTIYKKQKLDRDDVIDITDFDVVAWLKSEMRLMLNEEIARAALVSDGRAAGTDDKISEENIRPIWKDNDTYVVRKPITLTAGATDDDKAKAFIRAAIKSRKDYKGSGNPTMFTTEDMLTDCLLLEDGNGRVIYETVEKLRTALRVKEIVTVPVMENLTREGSGTDAGHNFALLGIMVNMADYGFGADKGGSVSMFDDFDIDFNQMKYLIETRCSGALMKYHSAVVIENKTAVAAG